MFRSKFSASVESLLFSRSSSSSVSVDCGCTECEKVYGYSNARRPSFFRRSFPSLGKLHVPPPLVRDVSFGQRNLGLRYWIASHSTLTEHASKAAGSTDLHGVQ